MELAAGVEWYFGRDSGLGAITPTSHMMIYQRS
jgi:hypothetical protein